MSPTTPSEKPFRDVAPGQAFVDHGSLYRKRDDQSAELIRWASGHLPDECIVHQFRAETLVKPIRQPHATMPKCHCVGDDPRDAFKPQSTR